MNQAAKTHCASSLQHINQAVDTPSDGVGQGGDGNNAVAQGLKGLGVPGDDLSVQVALGLAECRHQYDSGVCPGIKIGHGIDIVLAMGQIVRGYFNVNQAVSQAAQLKTQFREKLPGLPEFLTFGHARAGKDARHCSRSLR